MPKWFKPPKFLKSLKRKKVYENPHLKALKSVVRVKELNFLKEHDVIEAVTPEGKKLLIPHSQFEFVVKNWKKLVNKEKWVVKKHSIYHKGYHTTVDGKKLFMKDYNDSAISGPYGAIHEFNNMIKFGKRDIHPKITVRTPKLFFAGNGIIIMEDISEISRLAHPEGIIKKAEKILEEKYNMSFLGEVSHMPNVSEIHLESYDEATGHINLIITDLKYYKIKI